MCAHMFCFCFNICVALCLWKKSELDKEVGWKAEVCKGSLGPIGADATVLARP